MAEQDLDRNESATPHKLEKARERGQVAKSADVVSAIVYTVAVVFLAWQGEKLLKTHFNLDRALLMQATRLDGSAAGLWAAADKGLRESLLMLIPFLAALMIAAVVGNIIQTGPVLSAEPLKMDWERINPVAGFKRIFSLRTLFNGARACLKLLLLGTMAFYALKTLLPHFYSLSSLSTLVFLKTLLDDFAHLGFQMALILGLIALVDLMFSRREFSKQMRMSKREQKDEVKQRDGDPRIRSRMRELRRDMLKKSLSLRKTKDADVLITNPTHIAVALRYVQSEMASPQLIAKGTGKHAASMREIAARHRIPVVQNPPLARRLYRELDLEHHVPQQMFAEVARIIVWVFAMRQRRAATMGGVQ